MYKNEILLIIINSLLISSLMVILAIVGGLIGMNIPELLVSRQDIIGLSALVYPIFAFATAMVFAVFSFFPAFLLSCRLSFYLRNKKGWPIPHPRRIFLLSLLIVLSPLFLIILSILFKPYV